MRPHEYVLNLINTSFKDGNSDDRVYDENIHVSDLLDFCPRKIAICRKNDIPIHTRKYVGKGLAITFELGKKIQGIVTNRLNKSKLLVGTWICLKCNHKYFGIREDTCPKCNKKTHLNYIDTKLTLKEYGIPIVGHVDVMLAYSGKEIIVIEVKSIRVQDFDTLTDASRNHKAQLSLYLWLLSKKAEIKYKGKETKALKGMKIKAGSGVVLYMCKQQKNEPIKTFLVKPDKEFIKDVEDKLELLKTFSKDGKAIKPICTSKANSMARACHVRNKCFEKRKSA